MQHHTKDFFNEDDFLRATVDYGSALASFPLLHLFLPVISFLIHKPGVGESNNPHPPTHTHTTTTLSLTTQRLISILPW